MFKEDLQGGGIGTKGAYMQFQHCGKHKIPCRPGNIVGFIESAPAEVGTDTTKRNNTITDGKYAKECHFLSDRDLKVPVQKGRKESGDKVLYRGNDTGGEHVGTFIKTLVFVSLQLLDWVHLIPKCRDRLTSEDRCKCKGDTIGNDESDTDPSSPPEWF